MARKQTRERTADGLVVIFEKDSLSCVNGITKENARKVVEHSQVVFEQCKSAWLLETGTPLVIRTDGLVSKWCMVDTNSNSQKGVWFASKARQLERHVVERLNKFVKEIK